MKPSQSDVKINLN